MWPGIEPLQRIGQVRGEREGHGADFMAIGTDVTLLVSATAKLREDFLAGGESEAKPVAGY